MKRERLADGFPKQQMIVLPRPIVEQAMARPVTRTMLPTDIGYFPSAESHYIERRCGVPSVILIYCVRGGGWMEVGGHRSPVAAENVLIIPPGQPHCYGANEQRPWTIYWCHVLGSHLPHLLDTLGVRPNGPGIIHADSLPLVPLFEKIILTLGSGYSYPSLLLASTIMGHLFGQLIAQRGMHPSTGDIGERLDATVDFMKEHLGGFVRIAELAAMSRLSPSHYAVLFKRKTGYAVLDYFVRIKIQEACRLLDMTTLPVGSVANRLGYDDPLYFSRVFRKVMGLPPREYRALRKG